ncbi:copb1, partial [Symbiodinium sp. KB8]
MAGSGVAGEAACTLMINTDKVQVPTAGEIQKKLENKDPRSKADGLKQIILGALAGEDMGSQLMTVIRFCINEEDKEVKKLLMIFWEVIKKHDASGKLRPEMMLVCNALRNQLIHPNEFLRGCTLRFLCKVRERDVVEPLVPAITACLKHRVAYVRRNAVTLIHTLYSAYGEDVVPDAPATIMEYLKDERDNGALRNAFQMLFDCDQAGAVRFYAAHAEEVLGYGDGFHLSVLQLAKKVCRADPSSKVVFIRTILALLESQSATVAYEAASTLVALSNAPTAIRASTAAYTKLLASTPDNNVKLVLLERLDALRARGHTKILRDSAMDVLRVLATPNIDIRRRVIQLATALISERNVEEVVAFLKKQIVASQATAEESGDAGAATAAGEGKAKTAPQSSESVYRGLLISAIHGCAVKYPSVASSVVHLLMDFLSAPSALDIIRFVREACERFPSLVHSVLEKLMEVLGDITSPQVLQVALWILGQYCDTPPTVQGGIKAIRECLGSLPLTAEHRDRAGSSETEGSAAPAQPKASSAPRTLPDGSYPSMTTVTPAAAAKAVASTDGPHLRRLLVEGDFFLGASIASTMCKLALRVAQLIGDATARPVKGVTADAMLVMAAILELGQSQGRGGGSGIDQDSFERIVLCMRVLGDRSTNAAAAGVLLDGCKDSFKGYLAYTAAGGAKATLDASTASASSAQVESKVGGAAEELRALLGAHAAGDTGASGRVVQSAHEAITIRQLRGRSAATSADLALDEEGEVGVAVEGGDAAEGSVTVQQLTGVGDPVYAEAKVQLLAYDI